jgi:hypothetical protein
VDRAQDVVEVLLVDRVARVAPEGGLFDELRERGIVGERLYIRPWDHDLACDLDVGERIAHADADSDQLPELGREAGQPDTAACSLGLEQCSRHLGQPVRAVGDRPERAPRAAPVGSPLS